MARKKEEEQQADDKPTRKQRQVKPFAFVVRFDEQTLFPGTQVHGKPAAYSAATLLKEVLQAASADPATVKVIVSEAVPDASGDE